MSFDIFIICILFVLAGIEQDPSMSLPNSTLNFGFGFFILIVPWGFREHDAWMQRPRVAVRGLRSGRDGAQTACARRQEGR